jgi:hypothetical protein
MYPSQSGSVSEPFVQLRGHFRCRRANLQVAVSNQRGYYCPCRDPRCSFACHRAHGYKQAAILAEFLLGLPSTYTIFKGCMKFASGISKNEMGVVQSRYTRVLRDSAKKQMMVLKFRGFAHDTGPFLRHFDYLAFADASFSAASEVFKNAAQVAGLVYASTKEIVDRGAIKGVARYVFKVDERPEADPVFVFLPARDKTRLVWGSQKFFSPTTADAIWRKLRGQWYSPSETLTKKTTTNEALIQPYIPLEPEEAMSAEAIQWLLPWPATIEDVRATLITMKAVQEREGRFWLDQRAAASSLPRAERTFVSRVLGNRIPYHADFFPMPPSIEEITYEWAEEKLFHS